MDWSTINQGIIIGGVGGTAAGLAINFVGYLHRKIIERIEKRRVYSWLRSNTQDKDWGRFRTTRAIASWNNLTEDRTKYICSIHKDIYLSTGEKEDSWGVYGISGRDID
jgi:hypothetical protein